MCSSRRQIAQVHHQINFSLLKPSNATMTDSYFAKLQSNRASPSVNILRILSRMLNR